MHTGRHIRTCTSRITPGIQAQLLRRAPSVEYPTVRTTTVAVAAVSVVTLPSVVISTAVAVVTVAIASWTQCRRSICSDLTS